MLSEEGTEFIDVLYSKKKEDGNFGGDRSSAGNTKDVRIKVRIVKTRWRNNTYTGPAWMSFRSATLRELCSAISEM
jgi:hypothetical protein